MKPSSSAKLQASLDKQWCIRCKTRHPDGDSYDGVIVHLRRTFVVLREVRDFVVSGYIVLPKRAIRGIRDGELEVCENEILRQAGALKHMKAPGWLSDCEDLFGVLDRMRQKSIWPAIETLRQDGFSAFYLGPLQEVTKEHVSILCYSASGRWEKVYKLPLSDVFRIEFDSPYCNLFNRYMRRQGPPPSPVRKRS